MNIVADIKYMVADIRYAIKFIVDAASGIDATTPLVTGEWGDSGNKIWSAWSPASEEDAWYICVQFRNGRHLPLPLLLNWGYSIQAVAIRLVLAVSMFLRRPGGLWSAWALAASTAVNDKTEWNRLGTGIVANDWLWYRGDTEQQAYPVYDLEEEEPSLREILAGMGITLTEEEEEI